MQSEVSKQKRLASGKPRRERQPWGKGCWMQVLAALLWVPQAWLLAVPIGAMADGKPIWPWVFYNAAGVLLLGVLRTLLDAMGLRLTFRAARRQLSILRAQALDALGKRSPLDLERPTSGQAASVLTEQAEMIVTYLARYQPVQLKVMVVPLVLLAVVVYHSWVSGLVLLCAAPLIPIFMALIGWRAKAASEKQMVEMGQMNGFLLDRLRGMTTIRAFDAVDVIARRLRDAANAVSRKTMAVLRIAFLSSAVLELFSALGVALVAVYIGFHLLGQFNFGSWEQKLTLTQGMFILLLAPTFFDPLRELSAVWHDRASGVAAMDAMKLLSDQGMPLVGGKAGSAIPKAGGAAVSGVPTALRTGAMSVEMRQTGFTYPGAAQPVLQGFNLHIQSGQKVALVAPSGYGKSTLLALMAGLLHVVEGEVLVGGVALTDETADALRMRMGWISQQPHVFAGSLLYNITLGRSDIAPQVVHEAVQAAALESVASGQMDRRLGEGGVGLSGGEVLRLALARAFVTPALGLLLADEPTAHLDTQTAEAVMKGMLALAERGTTLVIATHDERVLPYMDRVISLRAPDAGDAPASGGDS